MEERTKKNGTTGENPGIADFSRMRFAKGLPALQFCLETRWLWNSLSSPLVLCSVPILYQTESCVSYLASHMCVLVMANARPL